MPSWCANFRTFGQYPSAAYSNLEQTKSVINLNYSYQSPMSHLGHMLESTTMASSQRIVKTIYQSPKEVIMVRPGAFGRYIWIPNWIQFLNFTIQNPLRVWWGYLLGQCLSKSWRGSKSNCKRNSWKSFERIRRYRVIAKKQSYYGDCLQRQSIANKTRRSVCKSLNLPPNSILN